MRFSSGVIGWRIGEHQNGLLQVLRGMSAPKLTFLSIALVLVCVLAWKFLPSADDLPHGPNEAVDRVDVQRVEEWIERIQNGERVQFVEQVIQPTDSGTETPENVVPATVEEHLGLLEGADLTRALKNMEALVASDRDRLDGQPTDTLKENFDAAMMLYRYEQALAALYRLHNGTYLVVENGDFLPVPNSQTMIYPVRKEGQSVHALFLLDEATFPQLGALRTHADDLKKQILIDHIAAFNAKSLEERKTLLEKVLLPGSDPGANMTDEEREQHFLLKREIAPTGTHIIERLWILELVQNR